MKLIADQKRRIVLPKPAMPGDVFDVMESGDRLILVKLSPPSCIRPPVSATPLAPETISGIDLDQPAFPPMNDESPA